VEPTITAVEASRGGTRHGRVFGEKRASTWGWCRIAAEHAAPDVQDEVITGARSWSASAQVITEPLMSKLPFVPVLMPILHRPQGDKRWSFDVA
jgi:hypothetical protein